MPLQWEDGAGDGDPLADLAELVINTARLIRTRTPAGPDVVAMTDTERRVMRIVDLYPGSAPSEIAERGRLQRTNVSTALGSLEDKGMVKRAATFGRGVGVSPTDLAVSNLRILREAWSRELANALGHDLEAVRRCNDLLRSLERYLIEP